MVGKRRSRPEEENMSRRWGLPKPVIRSPAQECRLQFPMSLGWCSSLIVEFVGKRRSRLKKNMQFFLQVSFAKFFDKITQPRNRLQIPIRLVDATEFKTLGRRGDADRRRTHFKTGELRQTLWILIQEFALQIPVGLVYIFNLNCVLRREIKTEEGDSALRWA